MSLYKETFQLSLPACDYRFLSKDEVKVSVGTGSPMQKQKDKQTIIRRNSAASFASK